MKLLAFESSAKAAGTALLSDGCLLAEYMQNSGQTHSRTLMELAKNMLSGCDLTPQDIDAVAVAAGPGSFTGVRIGVAAARALALAWKLPLHGYTAPSLIAAMAARDHGEGPIAVTITGGHGELFWQCFAADGRSATSAIASTPIATLATQLDVTTIYGTGAEALVTARGHGTAINLYPDAADHGLIAGLPSLPPTPIYGRGADAQTMAERAAS